MELTNQNTQDFKEAFKQTFDKTLSDDEATELAFSLLRLMKLVYQPITRTEYLEALRVQREMAGFSILSD